MLGGEKDGVREADWLILGSDLGGLDSWPPMTKSKVEFGMYCMYTWMGQSSNGGLDEVRRSMTNGAEYLRSQGGPGAARTRPVEGWVWSLFYQACVGGYQR